MALWTSLFDDFDFAFGFDFVFPLSFSFVPSIKVEDAAAFSGVSVALIGAVTVDTLLSF